MINKKEPPAIEEEQPTLPDEGWWASVLSDEEIFSSKEVPLRNGLQNNADAIDWDRIQALFDQDEIVTLKVQNFNRGGLLVEGNGLQGFVPISHLVDMPQGIDEDQKQIVLSGYVSRLLSLKVIECDPSQERVVFSERAALAGQGRRKFLFNSLKPGDIVTGTVTNITDFGVFVDLGGLEGLIHVSELSWGRVQHPGDFVKNDQEVTALVLQISEENSRVALSLKRLVPNPWETLAEVHLPGDIVPAEITSLARFGIFARLDEGVEGLIHISSINLPSPFSSLADEFFVGQRITVRILQIDSEKRRLGLSLVSYE
jgi:small subunit ribosomal protein S1